jgi:hypothetical protein
LEIEAYNVLELKTNLERLRQIWEYGLKAFKQWVYRRLNATIRPNPKIKRSQAPKEAK